MIFQVNGRAWKAEEDCKLSLSLPGKQGNLNWNLINNSDEGGQNGTPDCHEPQMITVFNKRVGEEWPERTMASKYKRRIQGWWFFKGESCFCWGKKVEKAFVEEVEGREEIADDGQVAPEALVQALV